MRKWTVRVLDKLAALRAADPGCSLHGTSEHHYRFVPPLPPAELARFEARYGVRLPSDFRQFLLEVGSGGCGPGYGLQRVNLLDSPDQIPRATPTGRIVPATSGPGRIVTVSEMRYADGRIADSFDLAFYEAIAGLAKDSRALSRPFPLTKSDPEAECDMPSVTDGTFLLCDYGCAIKALLVVTGDRAGTVCVDDRADGNGVVEFADHDPEWTQHGGPCRRAGPHRFADWYEDWLDTALEVATGTGPEPPF